MEIIYMDTDIIVCIKPPRVLSTNEPGGLPDLLRQEIGNSKADIRTVHRLDRVVSGLMVLARNPQSASELSRQIRDDEFKKEYYAVVNGSIPENRGTYRDFLHRDKKERKSYFVDEGSPESQEAILNYEVIDRKNAHTLVRIELVTGRTHQIRAQFSGHGFPLVGDRKYSLLEEDCEIALWSHMLKFKHPIDQKEIRFEKDPPGGYPWNCFASVK